MSNSLGTASLVLSTSSGKLISGLGQASTKITAFANNASKTVSSKLGGIGTKISAGLSTPLLPLAALAGAGLSIAGITGGINELASAGKKASSLGIASDQYIGLTKSLEKYGMSAEEAGATIQKLGAKTVEAASGNAELNNIYTQLGLNAKDLAKVPLDQQFIQVAEALGRVPNEAQQAQLGMKLFEEAGLKATGLFKNGNLQAGIDEFKRLGVAIGQNDMDKVMAAQASFSKLGDTLEGVWNKALVALAPFAEAISDKLTSGITGLQPVINTVAEALGAIFEVGVDAFSAIAEGVVSAFNEVTGLEDGLNNMSGTTGSVGQFVKGVFVTLGVVIGYVWDTLKAGIGAIQVVAGAIIMGVSGIITVFKEIISLAKELPDSLRPEWLDGFVAGVDDAAKAVDEFGQGVVGSGLKKIDSFGDSAKKVFAWDERTENEKRNRKPKVLEPKEATKTGELIGKSFTDTAKTAFAEMGSMEDYSIQAKFQNDTLANPQIAELKRQQELQTQANRLLNGIKDGITTLGNKVTAVF